MDALFKKKKDMSSESKKNPADAALDELMELMKGQIAGRFQVKKAPPPMMECAEGMALEEEDEDEMYG